MHGGMGIFRNASTSTLFAKMAYPLFCLLAVLALLVVGKPVLVPFMFSCLLAILLTNPARKLEKVGMPRSGAALICVILALVFFSIVFYFISSSVVSFKNEMPSMMRNIDRAMQDVQQWLKSNLRLSTRQAKEIMDNSTAKVIPNTPAMVNTAVSTVSGAVITAVVVLIQTFLLLLYRSIISKFFISLFADEYSPRIYLIFDRTRFVIRSYIGGLFIEMIIVAAAYTLALFLLGVKYALLLGVIGALLNLIPYLGIIIAMALTALITFTTNSASTVLWSVVAVFIIHLVDSNVLLPRIVGSRIKINALTTIMGVIVGGAIWQVPGMFLAVPAMAILKVFFEEVPAFQPFAILMDDDGDLTNNDPMLNQIRKKLFVGKKPV